MNQEHLPQHDTEPRPAAFTVSGWSDSGEATIEAYGHDVRSALEAGLRAVLFLSRDAPADDAVADKSAAVRGEGADLTSLFTAMIDDLLDQLAIHGAIAHIVVDGVLRREDGGYLAWGYVRGSLDAAPPPVLPSLSGEVTMRDDHQGTILIAASLHRG